MNSGYNICSESMKSLIIQIQSFCIFEFNLIHSESNLSWFNQIENNLKFTVIKIKYISSSLTDSKLVRVQFIMNLYISDTK